MAFTGTFKRSEVANSDEVFKLIGMPESMIKTLKNVAPVLTLKQEGSVIEETRTVGGYRHTENINLGAKTSLTQWNGKKAETVPELVNDKKYVIRFTLDDHDYVITREFTQTDGLLDTLDVDGGKAVAKFYFERA